MLLTRSPQPSVLCMSRGRVVALGVAGLILAVLCLPAFGLVSLLPDGYEAAVEHANQSGLAIGTLESTDQLAGMSANLASLQTAFVSACADYELCVVLLATIMAGGMAWSLARSSHRTGSHPVQTG
jgi:hypothetical protein